MADSEQTDIASALWYCRPGEVEIRQEALGEPTGDEVRVRSLFSGISRGTESLIWAGKVPQSEFGRMRAPFMAGDFPFPVKYGYASVGRIEAGPPALSGKTVFTLHPHQTVFNVASSAVVVLPDSRTSQGSVMLRTPFPVVVLLTVASVFFAGAAASAQDARWQRDYAAARDRGDFDVAAVIAGEASALIDDIPPAREIVERIVAEAERLMFR